MTPKLNTHDGHVATCMCCVHCSMTYEEDISDITPGAGFELRCWEGHFYSYDINVNMHSMFIQGNTCPDFEVKKGN